MAAIPAQFIFLNTIAHPRLVIASKIRDADFGMRRRLRRYDRHDTYHAGIGATANICRPASDESYTGPVSEFLHQGGDFP
jgi:hypothetical protein